MLHAKLLARLARAAAVTIAAAAPGGALAETRFVAVGDDLTAYRVSGTSGGTPILLAQRFRGNMDDWDPAFLDALDDGREVIVFNNVGVATSEGTVPDEIDAMADHMAGLIRALGHDSVDVLGWSMGGFVVQSLAARHPELVGRLVLVGTGPAGSAGVAAPAEAVFDVATRPSYGEAERTYLFFADAPSSQSRAAAAMARIDAARDPDGEPATTPAAMQAQAGAIQAFMGSADTLSIDTPTLIVAGDRDPFFPVAAAVALHAAIPDARLAIYPMTGHAPHHQWPHHVAQVIADFLSDTDPATSVR